MKLQARIAIGAIVFASVCAPLAAHDLTRSNPTPGATVSNIKSLSLQFSAPLDAKASGASLTMTGMPGMPDHPAMKMGAMRPGIVDGGRTLTLSSKAALAIGSYRIDWWASDMSGHKDSGQVAFDVN